MMFFFLEMKIGDIVKVVQSGYSWLRGDIFTLFAYCYIAVGGGSG
jgi:hypothetical protein